MSNSRRLLGSGIAFFILSLTLVKAWEIRNYNLTRYPGFSSIKEINLYDYHAAAILAANEGTSFYAMQQKLAYGDLDRYLELHPEQHAWTTGQRFTYMGSKAKKIIADEPLLFIKNYVKGIVFASIEPGAVDLLKQLNLYPQSGGLLGKVIDDGIFATIVMLAKQQPLMFWCNFIFGLLLVLYLCFAGGALLKRQTWAFPGIQLILLFSCYFLALSGGPSALSRFRHPLMPTISILSGYGLSLVLYGRVFFERFFKSTPEENYQSIYKHT